VLRYRLDTVRNAYRRMKLGPGDVLGTMIIARRICLETVGRGTPNPRKTDILDAE
jgi:hypothetical protein